VEGHLNYDSSAVVCWNSSNSLCNAGDAGCTCTPYCYTGIPNVAKSPLGYGPPDTVEIIVDGFGTYMESNPQDIRRWEVGDGLVLGGGAADYMDFQGDSNYDSDNVGSITWHPLYVTCDGKQANYGAEFDLNCSWDEGNNATCVPDLPLILPFTRFS